RISSCVSSHQAAAIKTECMAAIDYVRFNLKMLLQMGGVHVCAARTALLALKRILITPHGASINATRLQPALERRI
ncbi:hypothetical protein, partial [Undibacterium sp. Ji49W]|uniref:hypothetical protein n=1 Tax=Undibacterium sp. Ji49W TaxID=3413040 RepID=UPI003BF26A0E